MEKDAFEKWPILGLKWVKKNEFKIFCNFRKQ